MNPLTARRRPVAPLFAALCACCASAVTLAPPRPVGAQQQPRTSEFVASFSTNTRLKQQVERLERLAAQKMWDDWLTIYQQLVDDDRDLVMARDDEFLVGVRYFCHQLLAAQPAGVRQKYRAVYDNQARKEYDKALAEGDAAAMRGIYSRYRFTSYGPQALKWSADRALDEGRSEWARVAYERLAKEPAVSASTLLRYAIAADAAGKPAEASSVLDRVRKEFGGQSVKVAGKDVSAPAAADQVAKGFRARPKAGSSRWSSFGGDAGDRNMGPALSGGLKKLWEFTQPTTAETVRPTPQLVVISSSNYTRARFSYLSFPAVVGDRVWVQGPRNISAIKLSDGKAAWDQQSFSLSRDEIPMQNADPRAGKIAYRSGRAVQAAPAVDGHVLVTRMPMVAGDSRWPADFAILALDNRTGAPLWRKTAGGEPSGIFYNIPAVQGNTVVTGVATHKGGITEYNAVALDAGTGEQLWSTYLGGGSDPLGSVDGSPAAIKDGIVWIESSLYTLNALDLLTGEVRLVYHYDPGKRTRNSGIDSTPNLTNEPISLIATANGPIVFAPRWGVDVVALDPATGKLLWSSPKGPLGRPTVGSLFAVDDKRAYICGDHIQAINLSNGAREWTLDPQAARSGTVGFAALCGDRIYTPIDGKIRVNSAADGKEIEVLDASDILGEADGLLTLVSVDGALLISSRDRVVALGRK
ncbi:MAG: outer rane biosis protein BamB [Armatimonadetes bacterium]|nr:outer rane biosis protein BamB [Armatimonadota bacterium]